MSERDKQRLSAWLDGELGAEEARELEVALERSPELRDTLARMRALDDALRVTPIPDVSEDLLARTRVRLDAPGDVVPLRPKSAPPRRLRPALYAAAAMAAALALALVVSTQIDRAGLAPEPPIARDETLEPSSVEPRPTLEEESSRQRVAEEQTPPTPRDTPSAPQTSDVAKEAPPPPEQIADRSDSVPTPGAPSIDDASDEELGVVLVLRDLGAVSPNDLDVIEQLDLLEMLAELDAGRGRG